MRYHILLLISITIFCYQPATSQTVPEMNFDEFETYLNKNNDTVYVINFWATWCKPCIEELPHFLTLASELKDEKVKFIFVSLDFAKNKEIRLIPFIKKNNITETVILLNDPNSNRWINKVNSNWSGAIPATTIYKGASKSFFEGTLTYNELLTTIKKKQQ